MSEITEKKEPVHDPDAKRQRKTTLCCLKPSNRAVDCEQNKNKWIILRFTALFFISLIILCCVYGLKSKNGQAHKVSLDSFYAVGDPVYARDLWLVVELASDDRGRRTQEGKGSAAHVCAAIRAAQKIGWTPLVVGARSPCCRSSRCRHLHPQDLSRLNYTSSGHFQRQGDIRMSLKTAGFLAAISKGAHFIYQANPEIYYRAGVTPKEYQSELEYQLKKTTLGISVGLVKSVKDQPKLFFDAYSHFGQQFQRNFSQKINQYKICEVKPPSIEKFLDTDGSSMDSSAPAFTIPGGMASAFDTRNAAFSRDAFPALFLLPENRDMSEHDQYFVRSLMSQALLGLSAGSTKFSSSSVPTLKTEDITERSETMEKFMGFFQTWQCNEYTVLKCMQALGGALVTQSLISIDDLEAMEMWVSDLTLSGFRDPPVIPEQIASTEPCIGPDALDGVYFHPSVSKKTKVGRQGKALSDSFGESFRKSEVFAARMVQRLCPTVNIDTLGKGSKFDLHDNILLIITFNDKSYDNIPLLEIMYRNHFKNILYCGEPDKVVDDYLEHYNGVSGTYFSFLPVHHRQSAGYECLLGAIEIGYSVDGFLVVDQNTLVNSWNFDDDSLDINTVWHGNEHAQNVTKANLAHLEEVTNNEIMRSMLGILHAFQFLQDTLLNKANIQLDTQPDLVPPPPPIPSAKIQSLSRSKREQDFSEEEMAMMHEDEDEYEETVEVSIVDDDDANNTIGISKEWHINLFGEIVHDDVESGNSNNTTKNDHAVSELLFHPANFIKEGEDITEHHVEMDQEHFHDMMISIQTIYQKINDKLKLWLRFKKMKKSDKEKASEEIIKMKDELKHLNCDIASNAEICHLVASFFTVLDSNEGENFQLVYDDLPIYYVPAALKDKLYLMANLFTKHHVADELAFPLLLRGLAKASSWSKLSIGELVEETTKAILSNPQDLLLLDGPLEEHSQSLQELEGAHYIYPVDVQTVLTNTDLRNVICRNF